jgi:hypothetical protein
MVGLEEPAHVMKQNCLHLDNRIVVSQDMHPEHKSVPQLHIGPQAVIVKCVRPRRFVTIQVSYSVKQNIS